MPSRDLLSYLGRRAAERFAAHQPPEVTTDTSAVRNAGGYTTFKGDTEAVLQIAAPLPTEAESIAVRYHEAEHARLGQAVIAAAIETACGGVPISDTGRNAAGDVLVQHNLSTLELPWLTEAIRLTALKDISRAIELAKTAAGVPPTEGRGHWDLAALGLARAAASCPDGARLALETAHAILAEHGGCRWPDPQQWIPQTAAGEIPPSWPKIFGVVPPPPPPSKSLTELERELGTGAKTSEETYNRKFVETRNKTCGSGGAGNPESASWDIQWVELNASRPVGDDRHAPKAMPRWSGHRMSIRRLLPTVWGGVPLPPFSRPVTSSPELLLLDASGSMELAQVDIDAMLTLGVDVVAYASLGDGGDHYTKGWAAWVVKDGRAATYSQLCDCRKRIGAGNSTDWPMMQWALKHRPSGFVYITDGEFFGQYPTVTKRLLSKLVSKKIVRLFETCRDYLDSRVSGNR